MVNYIFVVGKEDTLPLATAVYDDIIYRKDKNKPIILLISPLEEIAYPSSLRKIIGSRKYISCWYEIKKLLMDNENISILLSKKQPKLYNFIVDQIPSHPTQLNDLNK